MSAGLIDTAVTALLGALLVGAGSGVMRLFGLVDARAGRLERAATAYVAGTLWISTWMFLAALSGLPIARVTAAVGLAAAFLGYLRPAPSRPALQTVLQTVIRTGGRRRPLVIAVCGALMCAALLVALGTVVHTGPAMSHDAVLNWQLKARAFFLDGNLGGVLIERADLVRHRDYPLHLPLLGTLHGLVFGACRDLTLQLLHFGFLLAVLAMVGARVAAARGRFVGWAVAFALACAPALAGVTALATADVPFACTLLVAGVALQCYARSGDLADLRRAAFFLYGAAWTKNEGITLALFGLIAAIWLVSRRKQPAAPFAFWPLLLIAPWLVCRAVFGLTTANVSALLPFGVGGALAAVPTVLARIGEEMLDPQWILLWPAVLAALALVPDAIRRRPVLAWLIGAQFAAYLGLHVLVFDGRPWLLNTTLTRLLLHLLPAALVLASEALPGRVEATDCRYNAKTSPPGDQPCVG